MLTDLRLWGLLAVLFGIALFRVCRRDRPLRGQALLYDNESYIRGRYQDGVIYLPVSGVYSKVGHVSISGRGFDRILRVRDLQGRDCGQVYRHVLTVQGQRIGMIQGQTIIDSPHGKRQFICQGIPELAATIVFFAQIGDDLQMVDVLTRGVGRNDRSILNHLRRP